MKMGGTRSSLSLSGESGVMRRGLVPCALCLVLGGCQKSGAPHKMRKFYTSTTTIERNFEREGSDNWLSEMLLWSFLRKIFVM